MRHIDRTEAEMPFLDHLEELRWRIIWSLLALVLSVALGFFVVLRFDVLALLEQPILPFLDGHHVMATHPTDGLQLTISAAMWIGVVGAFPVALYQTWLFLAPRTTSASCSAWCSALVSPSSYRSSSCCWPQRA
jgi:sec-independent protein translocase protein TatC